MVKTIIQDKQMLFLVLFAAFFVGSAITGVLSDYEAEAKKDNNNGNNGCENANPNNQHFEGELWKFSTTTPGHYSLDNFGAVDIGYFVCFDLIP